MGIFFGEELSYAFQFVSIKICFDLSFDLSQIE